MNPALYFFLSVFVFLLAWWWFTETESFLSFFLSLLFTVNLSIGWAFFLDGNAVQSSWQPISEINHNLYFIALSKGGCQ